MNLNQCIFCDSVDNLNTSLTIAVDDGKVVVRICDAHAEDATVKSAREAYLERRKAIDALLAQAKALGLQIAEQPSGLVIATKPQPQTPVKPQQPIVEEQIPDGENVVPTNKLDRLRFQSVGGSVGNGISVSSHSSLDASSLTDKLPEGALEGFAELAVVEGRGGQPLAIPQRRVDKTGVTRITINKSTDAALQDRFKKMANDTMGDRTPDFARSGYQHTQRQCPLCKGACVVKQAKKDIMCPKCNGAGVISTY